MDRSVRYSAEELARKRASYRLMGWELADFEDRPAPPKELVELGRRVIAEGEGSR